LPETSPARPRGRPSYSEEFKRDALLRWIVNGNRKQTAKELGCNETSLRNWKEERPAVWEKLLSDYSREIDKNMTGGIREAAVKTVSILNQTLEQLAGKQNMISPEKLAQNAQQLGTTISILVEKTAMLEGRPQIHVHHTSAPELIAKIKAEFPGVIDSTAEEISSKSATPMLQSSHADTGTHEDPGEGR
jgi:hypothetical protein